MPERLAHFDCIGGLSGDMALAALLHAGADEGALVAGLRSLPLPPWELRAAPAQKLGIAAWRVEVRVGGADAGAAPLLHLPPGDAPLAHAAGHEHSHEGHGHEHSRDAPAAHAGTRTFPQVAALIRGSALPDRVRQAAEAVFHRLAAAEAAVHGTTLEAVHFHEVGAVDSIVDVVGTVFALHLLGVDRVTCSPLPIGRGFVRCAHGLMPNPAPATAELLRGLAIRSVDVEAELVTPTGAALAAVLSGAFGPPPDMTVTAVGYGAGTRDLPFPNLARVTLGEAAGAAAPAAQVTLLEANLDDLSPQLLAAALEALLAAGALDAWITPIVMKKGRPAHTLAALCEPGAEATLESVFFRETSTLGVRRSRWERTCLAREWITVQTPYGAVRVKIARRDGQVVNAAPEFEDCRAAAAATGAAVRDVHAAALHALATGE